MIKNFITKDISENNINDKKNDISYKYLPVSVFDVKPSGMKGIRGKQCHNKKSSRLTYSPFPQDIAEWCAEFHLRDNQIIFDPFAGWGERHNAIKKANKKYIGYDISQKAIDNAKEKFGVVNILANSLSEEIPHHDGLLTCPPYWNLEKYEKDGIDRVVAVYPDGNAFQWRQLNSKFLD